jgi:hypothetical protein
MATGVPLASVALAMGVTVDAAATAPSTLAMAPITASLPRQLPRAFRIVQVTGSPDDDNAPSG